MNLIAIRASAGMRAINELKPRLGLELTATPFTESNKGPVPFENVIVDYPLACAMDDGFVKRARSRYTKGISTRSNIARSSWNGSNWKMA